MALSTSPATETQYDADLKIAISELHDRYARCNNRYDVLQTKFFALLTGQLAVAGLLFANYFSGQVANLSGPLYGKVFFYSAVIMLMIALGIAFMSVSSNPDWAETPERRRIMELREIKAHAGTEFLERIKEDYEDAITTCEGCFDKRVNRLDWSIRLFVISVIMLLVLKVGG